MLYSILKVIARLAIKIFCRKIIINKPEMLKEKGPLLLACNHPNSFLDGVIFDTLFEQPIYTLARGDAFANKFFNRLLTALKLLPVYRISEGAENLDSNYDTFEACKKIFLNNGIVLIFSEGKCINEWHLRPLKKGTARLAIGSWDGNIPLRILPVGINYSSFRRFGKNIFLNFGEVIEKKDKDLSQGDGARYQSFNNLLEQQFTQLVFEIGKKDKNKQQKILEITPSAIKKLLLFIPATIGWIIHWPVYQPVKKFTFKRTNHNDHYDSVIIAILLFAYPLYLLLITGLAFYFTGSWYVFLLWLLFPFTAWACTQLKPQLDK